VISQPTNNFNKYYRYLTDDVPPIKLRGSHGHDQMVVVFLTYQYKCISSKITIDFIGVRIMVFNATFNNISAMS
jgi:hypothetical protein